MNAAKSSFHQLQRATTSPLPVFIGCSFAAKYPIGGGNFSVPLQYVGGLKRLGHRPIWLEVLRASGDAAIDLSRIKIFQRRMKQYDVEYCLFLEPLEMQKQDPEEHDFLKMQVYGMDLTLLQELARHGVILNLSYSIKSPLLGLFAKRLLCSLDPTEVVFWMSRMEMGQSYHDEFWSVGLCMNAIDSRIPASVVPWKSFFPPVDTELIQEAPRPSSHTRPRFTTIGQWYWDGAIEIEGVYRDYSKQAAFAPYLDLPRQVPEAIFELAINLNPDDPERKRLRKLGWRVVSPHRLMPTPARYYNYLANSFAEFTAVKLEAQMQSGWLSDRAAAYLATGRPVITEPTGAEYFLPEKSGMFFVKTLPEALEASRQVLLDWPKISKQARATALEFFESASVLKKMLG